MSQAKRLKFSTTVLGDSTPNTILKMQAAIRGSLHPAACPGQPQSTVLRSSWVTILTQSCGYFQFTMLTGSGIIYPTEHHLWPLDGNCLTICHTAVYHVLDLDD